MKIRLLISMGLGIVLTLALTLAITAQDGAPVHSDDSPALIAYLPLIVHQHQAACARPPTLISPANGATLDTLIPTLDFAAGSPAGAFQDVTVQIDTSPVFSDDPLHISIGGAGVTKTYQLDQNLLPATDYYWRVRDDCGERYGPYSSVYRFITGSDGVILPPPHLTAPISGTLGLTQTITLQWEEVAGAQGYQLHIRRAGQLGGWIFGSASSPHTWRNAQPDTAYEWVVRAKNDYAYGLESAIWGFSTGSFEATH